MHDVHDVHDVHDIHEMHDIHDKHTNWLGWAGWLGLGPAGSRLTNHPPAPQTLSPHATWTRYPALASAFSASTPREQFHVMLRTAHSVRARQQQGEASSFMSCSGQQFHVMLRTSKGKSRGKATRRE